MALADFLQALLRQPGGPQNALAQAASDQGSAGPNGSAAYQNALQAAFQAQGAPQASPQGVSPMQTGSVIPQGGNAPQPVSGPTGGSGLGDFLSGLESVFNPQARGRNATIQYLTNKGYDPGTATLIAGDKQLLRKVLVGGNDPDAALKTEKLGLEVANLRNPTTDDIREYQFAKNQGYTGSFTDFMQSNRKAGATNINLPGQPAIGSIPQGFAAKQDPQTGQWTMYAVPGGPADPSKTDAATADSQTTKTAVVTDAYNKAKNLIGSTTTGVIGAGAGFIPPSDAAELRRQVGVLKANATIENLNAMRRQSPTGGALGNVTEKEGAMLAAAAGALDPNASPEQFKSALDNYYHTILRIVNGPEAGDKMFNEINGGGSSGSGDLSAMPAPDGVDPNVWKFVPPEKRKLWTK